MTDKKFKISVIRTEYFTNFKKKTVACKLHYRIKATDYRMMYALNWIGSFVDSDMYADGTFTIVATAKTSPDDTFDPHAGEQIARAKAESMAYSNVSKFFDRVHKWYTQNIIMPMAQFIEKSNGVIAHNDRYIDSF